VYYFTDYRKPEIEDKIYFNISTFEFNISKFKGDNRIEFGSFTDMHPLLDTCSMWREHERFPL